MKKKLFVILMSIVMATTMMPLQIFAGEKSVATTNDDTNSKTKVEQPETRTTNIDPSEYLHFKVAETPNGPASIKLSGDVEVPNLEYSLDGHTWQDYVFAKEIMNLEVGATVYFKLKDGATPVYPANESNIHSSFSVENSAKVEIQGNVMSLVSADCSEKTIKEAFGFRELFSNDTSDSFLTAPKLPATTLSEGCYALMFGGCTSLKVAPELPATTLTQTCYSRMFSGCKSLIEAPELPAKTLARNCYSAMFSDCTSLTEAPELPAANLTLECYIQMFDGCSNLSKMRVGFEKFSESPADIIVTSTMWLNGVLKKGTYTGPSKEPVNPTIRSQIPGSTVPTEWTIVGETKAIDFTPLEYGKLKGKVSKTYVTMAAPGETVALSAKMDEGYKADTFAVTGKSGTNIPVTNDTFIMPNEPVSVTASVRALHKINLPKFDHGQVIAKVNGVETTTADTADLVTLSAEMNPGYKVGEFTVKQGETPITVTNNTFRMPNGDVTVSTTESAIGYSIAKNSGDHGEVKVTPDKTEYHVGDNITLSYQQKDEGWKATGYKVHNETTGVDTTVESSFTMPASNVTITPIEKQIDYTITTSPQHGEITVNPKKEAYHINDDITLGYVSDQSYVCRGFTVTKTDGSKVTVDANNHFTMPADNVTVTANEKVAYTINSKKADHIVSIKAYLDEAQKTEAALAAEGETIYLNAKSEDGYKVTTYHAKTEDGTELILKDNAFTMPNKPVTIWADVDHYNITTNVMPKHCKSITVTAGGSPVTSAAPGTIISATATAERGFKVTDIKFLLVNSSKEANGNYEENGLLNEWTYTMGTGDIWVIPTIEKASEFDITIDASVHGTITTSPAGKALEGETVILTYQPATGWAFKEWEVTKTGTSEKISVENNTFIMPEGNVTITATEVEVYAEVTFDSTGGTQVPPQQVKVGQVATKPVNPTKEGYTFNGWFLSPAAAGSSFDFENTPITEDLTLYANWTQNDKPTPVPVPPINPTNGNGTTKGINTGDNAMAILFAGLGLAAATTAIVLRKRAKNR